jgi:hypothetical protein
MIELPQSYYANPTEYKRTMIYSWKQKGVIYDEWDDLYDIYMNTMECQHCKIPFQTSGHRCLDHDHETGLFRMILCKGCNNKDSFLKYSPDTTTEEKRKVYYDSNRDKILEQKKEYRDKNKEVINQKKKEYHQKNKEVQNQKMKEYREQNRDKLNMKLNCFFCSKQMSRKSLGRHFYDGHCIIKPLKQLK